MARFLMMVVPGRPVTFSFNLCPSSLNITPSFHAGQVASVGHLGELGGPNRHVMGPQKDGASKV